MTFFSSKHCQIMFSTPSQTDRVPEKTSRQISSLVVVLPSSNEWCLVVVLVDGCLSLSLFWHAQEEGPSYLRWGVVRLSSSSFLLFIPLSSSSFLFPVVDVEGLVHEDVLRLAFFRFFVRENGVSGVNLEISNLARKGNRCELGNLVLVEAVGPGKWSILCYGFLFVSRSRLLSLFAFPTPRLDFLLLKKKPKKNKTNAHVGNGRNYDLKKSLRRRPLFCACESGEVILRGKKMNEVVIWKKREKENGKSTKREKLFFVW